MSYQIHPSNHSVEVYEKEALLQGANFNPTGIRTLNIFVFNFSSLNQPKADDRKNISTNGVILEALEISSEQDLVLPDTDEVLINIIRSLNPLVAYDGVTMPKVI
jgi:type III restriction enzyme